MRKPFFSKTVYLVDDGDARDNIAGYDEHNLAFGLYEGDEPLTEGTYVAVYELKAVKRYRTNPRLEDK